MNRRYTLPALLLIPLAVVLYLLPPEILDSWRLSVYGYCARLLHAAEAERVPLKPDQAADYERRIGELNATLRERDATIATLRAQLRQVIKVKTYRQPLAFAGATVIDVRGGPLGDIVTIDRGSEDGVLPSSAVLQGDHLAGIVGQVGQNASKVLLVSSPGCIVPARTQETGVRCSVHGRGGGQVQIVFYAPQTKAAKGEWVLTSGLMGKLPRDIPIGTLGADPVKGEEPNTLVAPLVPKADPSILENVLVVWPNAEKSEP